MPGGRALDAGPPGHRLFWRGHALRGRTAPVSNHARLSKRQVPSHAASRVRKLQGPSPHEVGVSKPQVPSPHVVGR
ncbi:MAG: hypothetical protein ACK53L_09400, partial [Pirellulaceae bacterium]